MYQKSTNLSYTPSHSWYSSNYHAAAAGGAAQFLAANGDTSPQQLYYSHVFHQPSPDWTAHESFSPAGQAAAAAGYLQTPLGLGGGVNHHHHHHNNALSVADLNGSQHGGGGGGNSGSFMHNIPTPPITVVGSDIPTPAPSAPPITPITPPTPIKASKSPISVLPDWIKKSSYQNTPNPGKFRRFSFFFK